ncbi:response regulator [Paludisphaera rhizosphaerae]|uniref:response regulator n=1 Tax=Paludisphaera rhizosphaerae TaxID=2711216 RepID=UPI0013EC31AA|nr:response regulator [Paludisphaera rhizosphaerae]
MRGHAHSALRILVVDDNVDTAACLAMLLQAWGYEAAEAHDGPEALQVAREQRPHAVVLDLGLPLMDGFEVARRLREQPGGKDVFIVCSSGFNQESDHRRAEEAGIDQYLVKPFDPFVLEDLLASRLACEALSS